MSNPTQFHHIFLNVIYMTVTVHSASLGLENCKFECVPYCIEEGGKGYLGWIKLLLDKYGNL
jgi:hypothetical protein